MVSDLRRPTIKLVFHGTRKVRHSAINQYYIISRGPEYCRTVAGNPEFTSGVPPLPGFRGFSRVWMIEGLMQRAGLEAMVVALLEANVVVDHTNVPGPHQDHI